MDITIGKVDLKDKFNFDKFNITFFYDNNSYEVTVYLRRTENHKMDDSELWGKSYDGEYILYGRKLIFTICIYQHKYLISNSDSYLAAYWYKEY